MVKVEEILGLLPPGHWPFLNLEVSFGLLRELPEELQVRTVGPGGQLRSHQGVIQPILSSWSEFGTVG